MVRAPKSFLSLLAVPLLMLAIVGAYLVYERVKSAQDSKLSSTEIRIEALYKHELGSERAKRLVSELNQFPVERRSEVVEHLMIQVSGNGESETMAGMLAAVPPEERQRLTGELGGAIQWGDVRMLRTLLEGGVPVRAPLGTRAAHEWPPLLWAIRQRSVDSVRLLIAWGADPNARIELKGEQLQDFTGPRAIGPKTRTTVDRGATPSSAQAVAKPLSADQRREMEAIHTFSLREIARRTGDPLLLGALERSK